MRIVLALLLMLVLGLWIVHAADLSLFFGTYWCVRLLAGCIVISVIMYLGRKYQGVWCARADASPTRVKAKCLAISCCWLSLLIYASLMSRTEIGQSLEFLQDFLVLVPLLLVVMPFYVRWADRRVPEPEDGYARFGQFLLQQRSWIWAEQKSFVLSWAVKVFFIPIMYSGLLLTLSELVVYEWRIDPGVLVKGLFYFGLAFDLLIAALGYSLATTLFRTEILSTDDTWLGWMVCLICYPPLLVVFKMVREQTDNVLWNDWLRADQFLYWVWLVLIVITWAAYWFSNACFGLRFSNLTWRGLVSIGPYAYFKHPSYLFKNIYWWLNTVPFVGVAFGVDMLRNVLALTFVSGVYYLRAKTEERHLLRFDEYQSYHSHMEEYGFFARVRRRLRIACES